MYPSLLRRVAATLIDLGVVFWAASSLIQQPLIAEPAGANLWLAIAFALIYEPVLSAHLCTVGQALMATRVRQAETAERITLRQAYLRFVLKYLASIAGAAAGRGMVRVWPREDRRALHDLQAGTLVVNAGAAS